MPFGWQKSYSLSLSLYIYIYVRLVSMAIKGSFADSVFVELFVPRKWVPILSFFSIEPLKCLFAIFYSIMLEEILSLHFRASLCCRLALAKLFNTKKTKMSKMNMFAQTKVRGDEVEGRRRLIYLAQKS